MRRRPLEYTAARRSRCSAGKKNLVSFIPTGSVMRVRTNSSSGTPEARSTTQPRMSVL